MTRDGRLTISEHVAIQFVYAAFGTHGQKLDPANELPRMECVFICVQPGKNV